MRKRVYVCLVLMLLSVSMASAATWTWLNTTGDRDFINGLNWLDGYAGLVFTAVDTFVINSAGTTNSPVLNNDVVGTQVRLAYAADSVGDLYITGGTSSFVSSNQGGGTNSTSWLYVSGGTTTFSSFFTVGTNGTSNVDISGGTLRVNRMRLCQNAGSAGNFTITGGQFTADDYIYVGAGGSGVLTASGGVLNVVNVTVGDTNTSGSGTLSISGTADINVSGYLTAGDDGSTGLIQISGGTLDIVGLTTLADEGPATLQVSGGTLNLSNTQVGFKDAATYPLATGTVTISGGVVNASGYFTAGNVNQGSLDLSGGVFNVSRILLGQETGSVGSAILHGGELHLDRFLEVGRNGTGTLTVQGNATTISCGYLEFGELSTTNLVLNGTAGIGTGFQAFGFNDAVAPLVYDGDVWLHEGAKIDVSFASGTDTAGHYAVITSSEPISYYTADALPEDEPTDLWGDVTSQYLSSASITAGWTAEIIGAGSGAALVLKSPVSGTSQVWNSGAATLNSALTRDYAVVGDTAAASLTVSTGANGQFKNLTVANQAAVSGQIAMTGGSVSVVNTAILGDAGAAVLNISGGTFSAKHLIAASDATASADLQVSGTAAVDVDGTLAIGAGADLTLTGFNANITAGNLSTAAGSSLTFKLDTIQGVGNGIVVDGNVILKGTITPEFIGDRANATFTLIRAQGDIIVYAPKLLDATFVTYQIVSQDGYNQLQVTFITPANCADVISTGFGLKADLNEDCRVNLEDFAVMAQQWLWCNDPLAAGCDWLIH